MMDVWKTGASRSSAVVVTCAALATAACAGGDGASAPPPDTGANTDGPNDTEPPETEPADIQPSDTVTATTIPHPTTIATTTAAATTVGGDGAECREIVHTMGVACVPALPQRIVALDGLTVLPTLVELEAPVVGALAVYDVGDPFPDYLDPSELADIAIVGNSQQPNLEAIVAARPDLIVANTLAAAEILDELETIAPTVVIRFVPYEPTWRDDVRLVGDAVDRRDRVDVALEVLDERIAEVRATIAANWDAPTLTRVDVFAGNPVYYRSGCTWFGELLASAGVGQPAAQGPDDCTPGDYASTLVYPSLEELDVLDADAIVAYEQASSEPDADPLAVLAGSPLWNGLPAVNAGRVFALGDAWGIGTSITSAHVVLDDLEQVVFGPGGSTDD